MNIGKIILLMFTLLIGVLQAQDEQQKGINDYVPSLTEVTHLKVCILIIRTKLNRYKTSSEIRSSCPPPCSSQGKCFIFLRFYISKALLIFWISKVHWNTDLGNIRRGYNIPMELDRNSKPCFYRPDFFYRFCLRHNYMVFKKLLVFIM